MLAAFAEDPFSMWLFAGWDKKIIAKKKEDYWAWICKSFPADGEIHAVGDLSGAALWYWHPEQRYVATQAATSTDVATTDIDPNTPEGFQKFLKGLPEEHHAPRLDVFNRCYEAMPREACWYLGAVGVMPNRQGQGLGSALLASMLKRCDRQGLPAYLESSNPDNVSFYARLGFKPFGEAIPVPDSKTPPLIPMLRLPNMAEGNAGAVARGL